jgi:cell division inhibitor SulA
MGTETNMFDSAGQWNPDSDQIMNLRRTAANHKPYLLLLNTDFTKVSSASLSLYFQECLFYDIYPSMFSVDAADAPYWQDPALYNRDRPLFVLYIPLLQELSTAGWQPVTDAAASNKSLWIERYGSNLFTVRNATSSPITTTISVDMSKLFPGRKLPVTVKDEIGHREISADMSRGSEQFPATVGPNQTLVLRLVK